MFLDSFLTVAGLTASTIMRLDDPEPTPHTIHDAVLRGMLWLADSTLNGFSSDEAQCFGTIRQNAFDASLAEDAARVHDELLANYAWDQQRLEQADQPRRFIDFLSFCSQCDVLNRRHPQLDAVRKVVAERGEDFFWNISPEELCGANCTTLINYYHFDRLNVPMRHSFGEVVELCGPRALRRDLATSDDEFEQQIYFATHWVYALSDYGAIPLRRDWHSGLYAFLRDVLADAYAHGNLETLGEVIECLKIFGDTNADPAFDAALRGMLKRQNPDGSWGSPRFGTVIHTTWCCLTALYDYREHADSAVWGPTGRRRFPLAPDAESNAAVLPSNEGVESCRLAT